MFPLVHALILSVWLALEQIWNLLLPDSLVLRSLSLHCVVIDRETSSDFMPDCLCLCQVQVGSGCSERRCSAFFCCDVQHFSRCSSVDAIYIRWHMCQRHFDRKWSNQSLCCKTLTEVRALPVTEMQLHMRASSQGWEAQAINNSQQINLKHWGSRLINTHTDKKLHFPTWLLWNSVTLRRVLLKNSFNIVSTWLYMIKCLPVVIL